MEDQDTGRLPNTVGFYEGPSQDPEEGVNGENIHIYDHRNLSDDKLLHHSYSDKLVEDFIFTKSLEIKSQFLFLFFNQLKIEII